MTTTRILTAALAVTAAGLAVTIAPADAGGGALHASATLVDSSGARAGTVRLVEDADGSLHVNVKVAGLTPGDHGLHIHAVGSCASVTGPFSGAGGHHNPGGGVHGAHAGDLPNLRVNSAGRGRLGTTTDHATLSDGPMSVFDRDGSAVIVHADADNYVTDPTGNSGARVACGVITRN